MVHKMICAEGLLVIETNSLREKNVKIYNHGTGKETHFAQGHICLMKVKLS